MRSIQSYYPAPQATCFGCGPQNPHGLKIDSFWQDGQAVCRFTPGPEWMAYPGVVYGGLIASLIDCHSAAAATAAAYEHEGRVMDSQPPVTFVTGTLTVRYLKPTPLGPELTLLANVTEMHPKKALVHCSLLADDIERAQGEMVAVRAKWQAP